MASKYYTFTDINGASVKIDYSELMGVLKSEGEILLFGLDHLSILTFRKQYLLKRGSLPITAQKIDEVFSKEKQEADYDTRL